MCIRCRREGTNNRFSAGNHMDLGRQPYVLGVLTQVEEMLIAHGSPILQVMHSIGGQYNIEDTPSIFHKRLKMLQRHCHDRLTTWT